MLDFFSLVFFHHSLMCLCLFTNPQQGLTQTKHSMVVFLQHPYHQAPLSEPDIGDHCSLSHSILRSTHEVIVVDGLVCGLLIFCRCYLSGSIVISPLPFLPSILPEMLRSSHPLSVLIYLVNLVSL